MTDYSTDMTKWTLAGGGVIVNITAKMNADGSVTLSYALDENFTQADLNGLFIDFGNNGGSISSIGSKANNMNGSDTDGDALNGFDMATVLGSVSGSDADHTSGTWTISAADLTKFGVTSLEQLATAEIGIRATSVGIDREGSVKLADTGVYCPGKTPTDDYPAEFPLSNATLIFQSTDETASLDKNGDGYIAVKTDGWDLGKLDFTIMKTQFLPSWQMTLVCPKKSFLGSFSRAETTARCFMRMETTILMPMRFRQHQADGRRRTQIIGSTTHQSKATSTLPS